MLYKAVCVAVAGCGCEERKLYIRRDSDFICPGHQHLPNKKPITNYVDMRSTICLLLLLLPLLVLSPVS